MTTLLSDIDAFLAETGIAPTKLGREAVNDPSFVAGLRDGRRCWPETERAVRDRMAVMRATLKRKGAA